MFDIAEKHSFASTFTAGTTFENRAIFGLILKHTPAPATRGLFIDCGIHAVRYSLKKNYISSS